MLVSPKTMYVNMNVVVTNLQKLYFCSYVFFCKDGCSARGGSDGGGVRVCVLKSVVLCGDGE